MELNDGAFDLVHGIEISDDAEKAFSGVNHAFLVGSRPAQKAYSFRSNCSQRTHFHSRAKQSTVLRPTMSES